MNGTEVLNHSDVIRGERTKIELGIRRVDTYIEGKSLRRTLKKKK